MSVTFEGFNFPWRIDITVGDKIYKFYKSSTDYLSIADNIKYEIHKTNPKKTANRQTSKMSQLRIL